MTAHTEKSPAEPQAFRSLPEVFRSVAVPTNGTSWRRFLAFAGPGFMVSVGYMDPGNWGTDMAGGSKYGYTLLWVILASNLMAQLLQVLCARLGLVTGKDLAMACRDYYKKPVAMALWLLCEVAIIACDLAEVLGSAIAINLLFPRISLTTGVLITGLDVLILLGFMKFGFRKLEAIVITLVATVGACFAYEIFLAQPNWGAVGMGLVVPRLPDKEALLISVGILGATVMPHNLYLHSAIVQTRRTGTDDKSLKEAIKYNTWDTIIALSAAFFVNAAILILAAATFHQNGQAAEELKEGHLLLQSVLGGAAATVFAIALLASGQSSTITGTLAGQIVMEGFLRIRIAPWLRRIITRSLAIIPALIMISATGGRETVKMLTYSQVILSMQLSFAIFPLMAFTSDKVRMGKYANPLWLKIVGYLVCTLIAALNIHLLNETLGTFKLGIIVAVIVFFGLWVKYGYKEKPSK